jgi:hypothetical protein
MAAQSPRILEFQHARPADTSVPATDVLTKAFSDTGEVPSFSAIGPTVRGSQFVPIQDLGTSRSFVYPLYVSVEQNGDEWLALSHDLGLVGAGESEIEAIDELRSQIGELFDALVEMRADLGPLLRNQLAFLERLAGTY